jgi:sulfur carrier protein ThiS adenylyltransferase
MNDSKLNIFTRNSPAMNEVLPRCSVGVAGCGGLGSNAAIALARAGVGRLIIADFDIVEPSNLNRQYYFIQDIGKFKVHSLAEKLQSINPDLKVVLHNIQISPDKVAELFGDADLLIEAFDRAESKKWLIESWCRAFPTKPIVCGNGLSGYGNTDKLKVTRMGNIYFCGDLETDMSIGLCSARVAIAANMQANVAIELLINKYDNSQR